MKNILVPSDFSICASSALDFAVEIAIKSSGHILIHHTWDDVLPTVEGYGPSELEDYAKSKIQELIDEIKSRPDCDSIELRSHTANGSLVSNLSELVEHTDADLIVMGTQGASGLQKVIVGTSTVAVVSNIDCPTLVIPENSSAGPIKSIALASDAHLDEVRKSLEPLKELALLFGAGVDIVNVQQKDKQVAYYDTLEANLDEGILGDEVHQLFKVVYADHAIDGLDIFIKSGEKPDMIAMLKHKHNLLEHFFNPSLTKKMAFHTEIPLLVLHG